MESREDGERVVDGLPTTRREGSAKPEGASFDSALDQSLHTTNDSDFGCHEASGVLVSKTSNYYLVRGRGAWVPVRLMDLYDADGQKVQRDTPFATMKNRLVTIKYFGGVAKAFFCPEGTTHIQATLPENARRPVSSSPPAYRNLLSLTKTLSEDVTALALAQSSNPRAVGRLIETAKHHMLQKLPPVIEELEAAESRKAQKALKAVKLYSENASLATARVVCDVCKIGKSAYVITCGHRVCTECLRPQHTKCGVCNSKFTKVDLKLTSVLRK